MTKTEQAIAEIEKLLKEIETSTVYGSKSPNGIHLDGGAYYLNKLKRQLKESSC